MECLPSEPINRARTARASALILTSEDSGAFDIAMEDTTEGCHDVSGMRHRNTSACLYLMNYW
jgi:hypothetical protein